MRRKPVVRPEDVERASRDPRFLAASASGEPHPEWRSRGLCLTCDPDVFFPAAVEDPGAAVAICRRCPVAATCLATALDAGDVDGVWGATTQDERRPMRQLWLRARANA